MTLRGKTFLPLAVFGALFFLFLYGYWFPRSLRNLEQSELQATTRHLSSVGEGLVPLLLAHQLDTVYGNLDALLIQNKDWVGIRLINPDGMLLYPVEETAQAKTAVSRRDLRTIEQPIHFLGNDLGKLKLTIDLASIAAAAEQRHRQLAAVLLAVLSGLLISIWIVVERVVRKPVNLLAHAAERLAQGDYDAPLPGTGDDEVGSLVNSFAAMRNAIRNSTEMLHLQTVELEEEVAERQMAQESLQEKALLLEEEIEKRQMAQDELEQLNQNLEQRVQERTAELAAKNTELERMNKVFVGRELRMVELKTKIKELEKREESR